MDFIKTVTDAFNSLAQNFNDRIRSPIGGAFFFSWLVFNWKFVYYFMVQVDTAENKIKHITYSFIDVYNLLVYPALAAVAYILLFPFISNVSTLVWTVIDKWLKTFNAKIIENKVPISKEEQEVLYGLMHDQNKKHKEEKDKLQDQINALNAAFKSVEPETVDEKNRDGILAEVPNELDEELKENVEESDTEAQVEALKEVARELNKGTETTTAKVQKETEALDQYSVNPELANALKETEALKEANDDKIITSFTKTKDAADYLDSLQAGFKAKDEMEEKVKAQVDKVQAGINERKANENAVIASVMKNQERIDAEKKATEKIVKAQVDKVQAGINERKASENAAMASVMKATEATRKITDNPAMASVMKATEATRKVTDNSAMGLVTKATEALTGTNSDLDTPKESSIDLTDFELSVPYSKDAKRQSYIKGFKIPEYHSFIFNRSEISQENFELLCEDYYDDTTHELELHELLIPTYNGLNKRIEVTRPWELGLFHKDIKADEILSLWNADYYTALDEANEQRESLASN